MPKQHPKTRKPKQTSRNHNTISGGSDGGQRVYCTPLWGEKCIFKRHEIFQNIFPFAHFSSLLFYNSNNDTGVPFPCSLDSPLTGTIGYLYSENAIPSSIKFINAAVIANLVFSTLILFCLCAIFLQHLLMSYMCVHPIFDFIFNLRYFYYGIIISLHIIAIC